MWYVNNHFVTTLGGLSIILHIKNDLNFGCFSILFCHGVEKKSFYYPFQRAGGTPTVPWVMAYQPSMAFYKIYHSSVLLLPPILGALTRFFLDQSLNGILHTKLDLNYQKKSREK